MAILPLQLARVSNTLRMNVATQNLASTEQSMLEVQNELATGKRINTPSDDPNGAAIALQLQKTLDRQQTYLANLQQGSTQLGQTDSALGDVNTLLQQAQQIASSDVGTTASNRQGDAQVIQSLYSQMLNIGNTQFEGSYIFGGTKSSQPPFVDTGNGVQFVGSNQVQTNYYDDGTVLPFGVTGTSVFGGLSSAVKGSADLTPDISAATQLADLRGTSSNGVRLGSIQIGNGTITKTVDLSGATSVGDVINAINAAGAGTITATIGANGQSLTLSGGPADNISVTDVGSGTSAADLGIATATPGGAGVPVNGSDVNARVTIFTPLAALNGGAGIDLAHGIKITNGPLSATINFTGATTVQDLLNKINNSNTGVQAQINAAGTGIDVLNTVSGTPLNIGENGGSTATDLGIRSYSPATALSDLNGGKGVGTVAGGDFTITRSDGTSFSVSLTGAKTVQDVISAINTADGGHGTTASFATTGNGIVLTDTAGGGSAPTVTALNFSTAAADLGLTQPASGNVTTGTDVNPVTTGGIFANLAKLQQALQSGDSAAITAAAQGIQADISRVTIVRGQVGAREQQMSSLQTRIQDQNTATQGLLSNIEDVDYTQAASQFSTLQVSLQAALQTTAKMLNQSLLDFIT